MNKGLLFSIIIHVLLLFILLYSPKYQIVNIQPKAKQMRVNIALKKKDITTKNTDYKEEKKELKKVEKIIKEEVKKKKVENKIEKSITKNNDIKKKKEKKKIIKEESIFNIPKTDTIGENDVLVIKQQVENHWNKTACFNKKGANIKIHVFVNQQCNLILRNILETNGSVACTESAIRAVKSVGELDIDKKKCLEYSNSVITLNFDISN